MHPGVLGYICALMVGDFLHLRRPYRLLLGIVCLVVALGLAEIVPGFVVHPKKMLDLAASK